jgi:hypothetical protein
MSVYFFDTATVCSKAATGRRTPNLASRHGKLESLLLVLVLCLIADAGCTHPKVATPAPIVVNERLVIAYNGEEGKTALEILKSRAQVRTSTSSLGELVEEINGVKGNDHEHMLFFVNGQMSKVGAGAYVTKAGDRIEWKLVSHGGKK